MLTNLFLKLKERLKPKEKTPEIENNYVCINCGHDVPELLKNYSCSHKIIDCENCHQSADKYIEFELLLIIIDLVLLSKQAQRHLLFNTNCRLWKVSLIVLILESYCLWMEFSQKGISLINSDDPLYSEKGFYMATLQILLANFSLFILIRLLTATPQKQAYNLHKQRNFTLDLFKGFMLANISKFFFLPIIIWKDNSSDVSTAVHLMLVVAYFIISLVYVHSTVVNTHQKNVTNSKKWSAIVILLAFVINKYFFWKISLHIKAHLY